MKISAGILADELGRRFDIEAVGDVSNALALSGVLYYRPDEPTPAGRIWIADKDTRPPQGRTAAARKGAASARDAAAAVHGVCLTRNPDATGPLAAVFETVFLVKGK
jgi:hypothetical protein